MCRERAMFIWCRICNVDGWWLGTLICPRGGTVLHSIEGYDHGPFERCNRVPELHIIMLCIARFAQSHGTVASADRCVCVRRLRGIGSQRFRRRVHRGDLMFHALALVEAHIGYTLLEHGSSDRYRNPMDATVEPRRLSRSELLITKIVLVARKESSTTHAELYPECIFDEVL